MRFLPSAAFDRVIAQRVDERLGGDFVTVQRWEACIDERLVRRPASGLVS